MTATVDVPALITKLEKSVRNAIAAKNPTQRTAALQFVINRATQLCDERDRLYRLLDRGFTWLNDHPDHAKHPEREAQWFAAEVEYRTICDALESAKQVWSPETEAA